MIPPVPLSAVGQIPDAELGDLWHKLCVELMDERFGGRTHGNRRTRDAGCDGPMCRKAVREHGRRRTATAPSDRYKYLDLILDDWFPEATARLAQAREKLLSEIAPAS